MSGANSKAMTLEERLVQHIKETGLGQLMTDEDAITELTRRAIHEAFMQPRRVVKEYGGYDHKDSPAVEAGREIAKAAATALVVKFTDELMADEAFKKAISEACIAALPQAILSWANTAVSSMASKAQMDTMHAVQETARKGLLGKF